MSILETLMSATIYEVNLRQYTPEGTFQSFSKHLPRLQKMGIKIIWFMPITPISLEKRIGNLGSYYACSNYTQINPEFGNLEDFKNLVNQAHQLQMKVIIDWVANHTGYDHHWAKQNPTWYLQDDQGNFVENNGWTDVIDLNYANQEMKQEMIRCMQFWITETHIDGFRCDMAHLVPLDFWKEAQKACNPLKSMIWLGEFENTEYHQVFQISYAWWWMQETEKYQKNESTLQHIIQVLHHYSQYPHHALKLFFTSNHDENSWNGTEIEKYKNNAKLWAIFSFTWINAIPLIYSGQEIPNSKRLLFFDKDCINWKLPLLNEDFYTRLIQLKLHNKAIQQGEIFILPTNHQHLFAFIRKFENNVVLVLLNFSNTETAKIAVNNPWLEGNFTNLQNDLQFNFTNPTHFELKPNQSIVYYK